VGAAQLAEQHGNELRPAGKSPGVALGSALAHQFLELGTWKKLEKLTEDAAKSVHGWVLLFEQAFGQTQSYEAGLSPSILNF
jgi:hypothetical protein